MPSAVLREVSRLLSMRQQLRMHTSLSRGACQQQQQQQQQQTAQRYGVNLECGEGLVFQKHAALQKAKQYLQHPAPSTHLNYSLSC
jgi:hypothetical protein